MSFPENIVPPEYLLGDVEDVYVGQIVDDASNVRTGTNPAYTVADFLAVYPGFSTTVPAPVLQMYLDLANASVMEARYKDHWALAMGLFVAHWAQLYLASTTPAGAPARAVLAAGEAKGLRTSKGAGGLSTGIDYGSISQDLDGWAAWKLTIHGQQFATIAKLVGLGNMVVW